MSKPKEIDFDSLISKYKKDNFKRMKVIDHEFLYSSFHPSKPDVVVCLEKNVYPKDVKIFNLENKTLVDEAKEEVEREGQGATSLEVLVKKKTLGPKDGVGTLLDQDLVSEDQDKESNKRKLFTGLDGKQKSTQQVGETKMGGLNILGKGIIDQVQDKQDKVKEEQKKEFEFEDEIELVTYNEEDHKTQKKFAISFWKISKKGNPVQFKEYGFDGSPINNRFYYSDCGKFIFFLLAVKSEEEEGNYYFRRVMILDSETLKINYFDIDKEEKLDQYYVSEAYLLEGGSILGIKTYENFIFYNMKTYPSPKIWDFDIYLTLDQEDKTVPADQEQSSNEDEASNTFNIYEMVPHFSKRGFVIVAGLHNDTQYKLFEVPICQDIKEVIRQDRSIAKIAYEHLNYNNIPIYNKKTQQWTFLGYYGIVTTTINEETKELTIGQNIDYYYDSRLPSSWILRDELWISSVNQAGDPIIYNLNNPHQTLELEDVNVYYNGIDVIRNADDEIVVISQSDRKFCLVLNHFEPSKEDPILNYLEEISEYKCLYPYVFYCKGNSELFIHCIYHPLKVYRLRLKNGNFPISFPLVFVCFLETYYDFNLNNLYCRENENLKFISLQKKGHYHMNVLNFNHFEEKGTFKISISKQFIKQKHCEIGSIVQASMIEAERKEIKGGSDYILLLQSRNQIFMKSFLSKFTHSFYNTCPVRFIQTPGNVLYFLQKDGQAIDLFKVKFVKDQKQFFQELYEFKSTMAQVFTHHEDTFYFMDESNTIRNFSVDPKSNKIKFLKQLELNSEDKQNFEAGEFEKITVTDKILYQKDKAIILHNSDENSKNYDMLHQYELFYCQRMIQGPTKVFGTKQIMSITKDCENFDVYQPEEEEEEEEKDEDEEQKALEEEKKDQVDINEIGLDPEAGNKLDKKLSLLSCEDPNIEEDEGHTKQHNLSNEKKQLAGLAGRLGVGMINRYNKAEIDIKLLYDSSAHEDPGTIEVIFMPYFDDNEFWLTYYNRLSQSYPKATFSTFVTSKETKQEMIIMQVGQKLLLFKRNGDFMQDLLIFKEVDGEEEVEVKEIQGDTAEVKKNKKKEEVQLNQIVSVDSSISYFLIYTSSSTLAVCKFGLNEKNEYEFSQIREVKDYQNSIGSSDYFKQYHVRDEGDVYQIKSAKEYSDSNDSPLNPFIMYKNDEVVFQNIIDKFEIIYDRTTNQEEELDTLDYTIAGDYLIVRDDRKVEYLKIFNNKKLDSDDSITLNLNLDDGVEILRILDTEIEHFIQIVFQDYNQQSDQIYVMTWDLNKNFEHSMTEVVLKGYDQQNWICRGARKKFNYIITQDNMFDLLYSLPFKFIKAEDFDEYPPMNINQIKLSEDMNQYLGICYQNTCHFSYSLFNLYYGEVFSGKSDLELEQNMVFLEHFQPRYEGTTFFHQYSLNFQVLELLFEEAQKIEEENDAKKKEVLLSIIYPNPQGETPFDIAIKNQSPKNLELMLKMLILLEDYRCSYFIRKHFNTLLDLELVAFSKYLEICWYKLISMKQTFYKKWPFDEDEAFIDYHTNYIGDEFFQKLLNYKQEKKTNPIPSKKKGPKGVIRASEKEKEKKLDEQAQTLKEEEEKKQLAQSQQVKEFKEVDIFSQGKEMSSEASEEKRIELSVLEFDWVFKGESATNFIKRLANTNNDELFANQTIKIIIMFLWQKFFYKIRNKIFVPYLVYMAVFLVYVTYIYEKKVEASITQENEDAFRRLDYFFIALVLAFMAFFLSLELRQIYLQKISYFISFWNDVDICTYALSIAVCISDLAKADPSKIRALGSVAILMVYVKLFYFLRLFERTAGLVRMIMQIVSDMFTFSVIFTIAVIAFGNSFYILALNGIDYKQCSGESGGDECQMWTGGQFLMTLIYSFRTGLGDFSTDDYNSQNHAGLIWLIFLACAILLQIILLNLLIAIMGDTFGRVSEISEQSKLKEIVAMISDNEFILDREKEFKDSKYIIIAKLEKAGQGETNLEDKIHSLKDYLSEQLYDQRRVNKLMNESTKEELVLNVRSIDQRIEKLQNHQKQQEMMVNQNMRDIKDSLSNLREQIVQIQQQPPQPLQLRQGR